MQLRERRRLRFYGAGSLEMVLVEVTSPSTQFSLTRTYDQGDREKRETDSIFVLEG